MVIEMKAVVTVAEMARMVGLSRGRFYQLIGSAFPHPLYDVRTKRPFYDEDTQRIILDVRRRNCGIDGKPILFYVRRHGPIGQSPKPRTTKAKPPKSDQYDDLIDGLEALGLTSVTATDVQVAVKELFPQGFAGTDQAEVVRTVFLWLKRRNTSDNVRR